MSNIKVSELKRDGNSNPDVMTFQLRNREYGNLYEDFVTKFKSRNDATNSIRADKFLNSLAKLILDNYLQWSMQDFINSSLSLTSELNDAASFKIVQDIKVMFKALMDMMIERGMVKEIPTIYEYNLYRWV